MWTDQQWAAFSALLRRGWPGDFTPGDANAYRVLLDDLDPDVAVAALKRLLNAGHRFRPSAAEILGTANSDPSTPTFAEAYRLIFGRGGALKARPAVRVGTGEQNRGREHDAIRERASELHPLVASFIDRQGIDRLRRLPLDDPEWGGKHRRDLEREWDEHVDRMAGREVAALASGRRRGELAAFDPLAALGIDQARQLNPGGQAA